MREIELHAHGVCGAHNDLERHPDAKIGIIVSLNLQHVTKVPDSPTFDLPCPLNSDHQVRMHVFPGLADMEREDDEPCSCGWVDDGR